MFHLIPSKDVRKYIERNGRTLTDFEAALIYEYNMIGCEKMAAKKKGR